MYQRQAGTLDEKIVSNGCPLFGAHYTVKLSTTALSGVTTAVL